MRCGNGHDGNDDRKVVKNASSTLVMNRKDTDCVLQNKYFLKEIATVRPVNSPRVYSGQPHLKYEFFVSLARNCAYPKMEFLYSFLYRFY